ncbi:unnamed protein product, partial [Cuscuta epithymum]
MKPKTQKPHTAHWDNPPKDFIKINIAIGNMQGGNILSGIIIRNDQGEPIHLESHMHQNEDLVANVLRTLQGSKQPRWKALANLKGFKEKFQNDNLRFAHINKICNRAARFVASNAVFFERNSNIYCKFVGIVKFDAISYP